MDIYIYLPMIRTLKKISNIVCAYGNISNFLKVYFNYVSNFPQLNASNKVGAQSRHTFQLRDPSAHNQSIRAKLSFPRIFKTTFNLELKRCREKKKEKKKKKKRKDQTNFSALLRNQLFEKHFFNYKINLNS